MASEHDLPEFDELSALLRRGPSDVANETPPPALWAGIEAAIGAEVVDLSRYRRRRRMAVAVAAVAAAVLVLVPTGLALRRTSEPSFDEQAALAALGDFDGSGQAKLIGRQLEVDTSGLKPASGEFYELWLLDLDGGDVRDLVALGTIDASGRYEIAEGVDLSRFDVVDISLEPDDGNPAHSGDSVLRGELTPAT